MAFQPTTCPDCPYPCNFILTSLPKTDFDDNKQRYDVRCRECGDYWVEIDEEDNQNFQGC